MQSEIDDFRLADSLKIFIIRLKFENNKIKAKNNKIMVKNFELKIRVVKLKDKQLQNELVKNLLFVL